MKTIILVKTSLRAVRKHAIRSFLTILGIMIGVAAIVVTFSIGRGAEEKIKAQIMVMGEGSIYLFPGNVITRGAVRSSLSVPPRLTVDDMQSIKGQIPGIRTITRGMYSMQRLEFGSAAIKDQLIGADETMFQISKYSLQLGLPFSNEQVLQRANVIVIGEKTRDNLFGKEYPIGKTIRVAGNPFLVIGVLSHQEHFAGTDDPNGHSYIPFSVAKKLFRQPQENEDDLGFIAFDLHDNKQSEQVTRIVKRVLRFRHDTKPDEEDDFLIIDQQSVTKAAQEAADVIKLFGLIAASISLLVGGIGVMNIMLVSVQERKQEIGLRIALGATKPLVQAQFLIEAATLCSIGGFIGIMIGMVGQWGITHFTTLSSIIEIMPIFLSFLVTICVGIFFGYYPAHKAAALNPIDALLER
jgi:putative ABC transport system permease protein